MRSSGILLLIALAGCGADVTRIQMANGRDGASISCDGRTVTWRSCYSAAERTCPGGYVVIDRQEKKAYTDAGSYPTRKLVVTCKS